MQIDVLLTLWWSDMLDPLWKRTMVCREAGVEMLLVSAAFPLLATTPLQSPGPPDAAADAFPAPPAR